MYIVYIDEDLCNGCNACAAGCPASILGFNGKAFLSGDGAECMGCMACVLVCATGAITVMEI